MKKKLYYYNAKDKIKSASCNVYSKVVYSKLVEDVTSEYIVAHETALLVIGAYGYSKFRCLIFSSTTSALVDKYKIPVLLFR